MSILVSRLEQPACEPVLLVASDFDGTIAPIVSDPAAAQPNCEALAALRILATLPQTYAAILSGRSLHDLTSRITDWHNLMLVGSHGGECENTIPARLAPERTELLNRVRTFLWKLKDATHGLYLEEKPVSLALHCRNADESSAAGAIQAILEGPARWPGVYVRHGKKVIELSVVRADKGTALQRIRQRVQATAILFMRDDDTDEDAMATLGSRDVGVRVGAGESSASFHVEDTSKATRILTRISALRQAWATKLGLTESNSCITKRTGLYENPRLPNLL